MDRWRYSCPNAITRCPYSYFYRHPARVDALAARRVVRAAAGGDHSVMIVDDGELWSCGGGQSGQLGLGRREDHFWPTRSVDTLEEMLGEREWLVDGEFSVADVAVAAYLNYVPLFFPDVDLSRRPNMASYMLRCASRPAFAKAFGAQHAALVQSKASGWLKAGASAGVAAPSFLSGLFGGK